MYPLITETTEEVITIVSPSMSTTCIKMKTSRAIRNLLTRRGCHSNAVTSTLRTDLPQYAFMMGESKHFSTSIPPQVTIITGKSKTARTTTDNDNTPITLVESEEELQEEWKCLERRVSNRKLRPNDGSGPSGRSKRNASAWDAENN